MTTLTDRQREILAFIAEHEHAGEPVGMRQILDLIESVSLKAVEDHLKSLQRKGMVVKPPLRSRAIRLTPAAWKLLGYSICDHCGGRMAPGKGRAA